MPQPFIAGNWKMFTNTAIARDIARSHGGDILLGDSPLGGLRATVRVPV